MEEDLDIVDGLFLASVEEIGEEIVVDVYGGSDELPTCGTIRYRFPDASQRRRQFEALTFWVEHNTVLTYVRRGEEVTLIDDAGLVRRALS